MALKSYHKETLNDNWFEERAEPLNGVLPNDGAKEYLTTGKADYAGAKPLIPRTKLRLVNERTLGQALLQSAGADISSGFRSALPRPNEEHDRMYLETTHRAAFGSPQLHTSASKRTVDLVPAGGASGRHVERGKSTSGTMGEVFKTNSEPQRDTASQRSWMYSKDPMIVTKEARASPTNPTDSRADEAVMPTQPDYRKRSTSITYVSFSHKGVFTDD